MYHGWADQAVPPFGTTAYYAAMAERSPDYRSFTRLYMIPAQYHCLGGGAPRAVGDLLTPLMTWVQDGQAPGVVSLDTVNPAPGQPSAVAVAPFDPRRSVPARGYNSRYDWIGRFH